MQKPLFLVKLLHYEYWTWWMFYIPLLPYWLWLAVKSKSLTFFTATNPCIDMGGFFGESKIEILNLIAQEYKPLSLYFESGTTENAVVAQLQQLGINYPIILKPNVGERGSHVEKIENKIALQNYLNSHTENFIVQEFVAHEIELGILYYRIPNEAKGQVSSVTIKEFLSVTGDGNSTVLELMKRNDRARFQLEAMKVKWGNTLNSIPETGQTFVLEPIGNHCRGTKFLNGNTLINPQLNEVFNSIALPIQGFYYGRFDLKVASIAELYEGKSIKIMELNGVSSEPAHIYDPSYSLFKAYKDLAYHWKITSQIAQQNKKRGIFPTTPRILIQKTYTHFWSLPKVT